MVKVFLLNVNELPDPKECPEVLSGLEEKRIEKIMRYRQEKDRKQSLGAGILLKKCLNERGISVDEIRYGEHGKPEVEGCFFNLSHSQDMAVCVISDSLVGCDIERINSERKGIAERFFTENEIQYLNQFDEKAQNVEFYRLWTMKESYLKMTGEGTSFPLNRVEFKIGECVEVYRDGKLCECHIKEYDIDGYKLTICSMGDKFTTMLII